MPQFSAMILNNEVLLSAHGIVLGGNAAVDLSLVFLHASSSVLHNLLRSWIVLFIHGNVFSRDFLLS